MKNCDLPIVGRCPYCYAPKQADVPHTVEECLTTVKHQRDVALKNVDRGQVLLTKTEIENIHVIKDLEHLLAMSPCDGESEYCWHEKVRAIVKREYNLSGY
jgi:hypothetical protein